MSVKNFWGKDRIRFYCMNEHDDPIEFIEERGKSLFYACPKYREMDAEHPHGYFDDEKQCRNHLGFQDAEKLVSVLEKQYEEQIENGEIVDLTNYKFSYGQIEATVLLQSEDDILYIGIINKRALYS